MKYIKAFWAETRLIFLIFILWRVGLFAVGALAFNVLTFKASFPYIDQFLIATRLPQWLWHWGNFDGAHYIEIALHGYRGPGLQAYFPMFPLLMRLGSYFTGSLFWSGLLLSNLAILAAGVVLYFLVKRDFNAGVARWSVVFLFAFPTSFFFGSIYTESIFLLFILSAYYWRGLKSVFFAFLSGITRLVGVFVPPLSGLLGVGLYALFLQFYFSNPFYFLTAQEAFKNNRAASLTTLVTPPQVIFRYIKIFATADPTQLGFQIALLELTAFIFGVAVIGYLTVKRLVPVRYLVFSWPALLLPSFSGTLTSTPRYLLTIFPIYIALAMLKSRQLKVAILVLFIVLLSLLTIMFTRGYWVS